MRSRVIAALLFGAILWALGLAASPQLHNSLHNGDRGNHECAATLMSSGSIEHSDCAPVFLPPRATPPTPAYRAQLFRRVLADFSFARLEHAPPAAL